MSLSLSIQLTSNDISQALKKVYHSASRVNEFKIEANDDGPPIENPPTDDDGPPVENPPTAPINDWIDIFIIIGAFYAGFTFIKITKNRKKIY